jgi:hypothetical protein
MSWRTLINASSIRANLGIVDSSQDFFIDEFCDSIISLLEKETGLDFDFGETSITKIYRNINSSKNFPLSGKFFQTQAWRTITKIEVSPIQLTPVWTELKINQDVVLEQHRVKPYPFILASYLNKTNFATNCDYRITGQFGFDSSSTLPSFLTNLFNQIFLMAYQISSNQGVIATEEKSIRLSVKYDISQIPNMIDDLSQTKLIQNFIKNYKIVNNYAW